MLPARRRIRSTATLLSSHYGDLVHIALMEAGWPGPSRVARGVRHLRDVGAAGHLTPIIRRRRDGDLSSDEPADRIESTRSSSSGRSSAGSPG
ncbi:hypothetical protein [Streptomyces sp. XY66]|uniref:hypothetical protein n=1 Tax=Streptomyces sp. XY66 TaxID=1415563 RepID=UPI000AD8C156|nr:hypothetical protein [Streptomyces sp. XY66]